MIHEERIVIRYYCYLLHTIIAMGLLQKNHRRTAIQEIHIIEALPYIGRKAFLHILVYHREKKKGRK